MIMAPAQSTFLWEQNNFVVEAGLYRRVRRTDLPEDLQGRHRKRQPIS